VVAHQELLSSVASDSVPNLWPQGDNIVFRWHHNRSDCGLDEDELSPPTRHCVQNRYRPSRHSRDDGDYNNNQRSTGARGVIGRRSNCIDVRARSKTCRCRGAMIGGGTMKNYLKADHETSEQQ
jgi:hypothetical protein